MLFRSSDTEGKFSAAPGYAWVNDANEDLRVQWSPGKVHTHHPHVIASDTEGKFSAAPGFAWVSDAEDDLRVVPKDDAGG